MILALDPSSTRTGYALGTGAGQIVEAGYFTPVAKSPAMERIRSMAGDLLELLDGHEEELAGIVVEVCSGRPGSGSRRGASSSLAIYGMAAGAMWMASVMWGPGKSATRGDVPVHAVTEQEWTRRVPKKDRQLGIAGLFPQYAAAISQDGGADVADAIGLMRWWFIERAARSTV